MPKPASTLAVCTAVAVGGLGLSLPGASGADAGSSQATSPTVTVKVTPRRSRAIGQPWNGRLQNGVQLPASGAGWLTWDGVLGRSPNRGWRRWATDYLIDELLSVVGDYRLAHPLDPRVVIGDLSRPQGGEFGSSFGGLGHASHQNGLDVDVFYPRRDGLEQAPTRVGQIDRELSQELVDRFVDAGAQFVFVGPNTGLRGPRSVVQPLIHHDDHMHVRFPNARPRRSG